MALAISAGGSSPWRDKLGNISVSTVRARGLAALAKASAIDFCW
jgi:hypothetical protein